jgi:hypothetical protein
MWAEPLIPQTAQAGSSEDQRDYRCQQEAQIGAKVARKRAVVTGVGKTGVAMAVQNTPGAATQAQTLREAVMLGDSLVVVPSPAPVPRSRIAEVG